MRHAHRAGVSALIGLATLVAGCRGDGAAEPPAWTVRDSAGVVIVENARPSVPAGTWGLTTEPIVALGRPAGPPSEQEGAPIHLGAPVDARFAPGGGLLVSDGGAGGWQIVFVFDPEGRLAAACGGAGDGPGALGRLEWADSWSGDTIAAYDAADHTLALYDTLDVRPGRDCEIGREMRIPDGGQGTAGASVAGGPGGSRPHVRGASARGAVGILEDGSLVAWWTASAVDAMADDTSGSGAGGDDRGDLHPPGHRAVHRVSPDGSTTVPAATLRVEQPGAGIDGRMAPFAAAPSLATSSTGLALAPGSPFEVRLYAVDGGATPTRIVRRAWAGDSLSGGDREAYVAWRLGRTITGPAASARAERERLLRELEWPATKPAVSSVIVADDGSIWVEAWRWHEGEVPPDPPPATWSVFSPTGRWVTDVEAPTGFVMTDVAGGRVAGVYIGADGDREVRVYEVVR